MDRQKEFVLRTLEERDIRFVRLWFTDVLGYLKSVAIAPAELEGAFEEGIGFDGSSIEGFARVSESDMVARPDPSTFQVLPWTTERRRAPLGAHVLRHHHARRVAVVGRLAARAAPRSWPRPATSASPATCTPRSSSSCCKPGPTTAPRRCPPTTAATSTRPCTTRRRTSAATPSTRSSRWASRWSSATTRARPASRRSTCATPTRCRWPTTS